MYVLDWITDNVYSYNSTGSDDGAGSSYDPNDIPSACDPNITDDELRRSNKAQSLTSVFLTVETVVWGVPALIVTILLGAGSDRLGRRH